MMSSRCSPSDGTGDFFRILRVLRGCLTTNHEFPLTFQTAWPSPISCATLVLNDEKNCSPIFGYAHTPRQYVMATVFGRLRIEAITNLNVNKMQ